MRRFTSAVVAVTALSACHGKAGRPSPGASAAPTQPSALAVSSGAAASSAPSASSAAIAPSAAASVVDGAAASAAPSVPDRSPAAGADACTLLRGPIQLSFTGAATLVAVPGAAPDQDPRIFFNHDGVAKAATLPRSPKPATKDAAKKPERLALGEPAERATAPGCVTASGYLFCMSAAGAIHRTTLAGEGDTLMATGRAGSSIAAAAIGPGHTVLAFLGDRRTSEGAVTLAFAALDEQPPLLLSEDGSGATFVALAPRADQVIAMYVDARRALTPLHARVLGAEAGKLKLGTDAVLFVGEGTDARTACTVAVGGSGACFGLLPISKDATTFGLAAVRIDETPRDDAPVTWSAYPGGIDRAPVAATSGVTPVRVLRVRPASADPKAKSVLELGEIDDKGAFKALCVTAESASFGDVSLLSDRFGTLWIAYTDADGTWIERRGKPL
jgi:hypothetical protein